MSSPFLNFAVANDLASTSVGSFSPKPTSLTEGQQEASVVLWSSQDGLVDAGVWECTPGRFTTFRQTSSEICHIISGRAVIRQHDGEEKSLSAGDFIAFPLGWKGEWHIVETIRKFFVVRHGS